MKMVELDDEFEEGNDVGKQLIGMRNLRKKSVVDHFVGT